MLKLAPAPSIREDKVAAARERLKQHDLALETVAREVTLTRLLEVLTASHPRQLRIAEAL